MKHVLCITSNINTGGAETFLMKIYRHVDRTRYQMDFCVNTANNFYAPEIEKLGGKIYPIVCKSKNPFKSFWQLRQLVKKNQYQYVMRVNQHALSVLDLLAAKSAGATHLIMRSSNASCSSNISLWLHKLFSFLPKQVPTVKIAPSDLAAQFTFGTTSNVHLLPNGLDIKAFTFSAKSRQKIRKKLNVVDKFVVGHIGRFMTQKNHSFLLKIFAEIKKDRPNAILWLVGNGVLESALRQQAVHLGVQDSVQFLGICSDIPSLLSAMDIFIFPSLFEGMPNTVIEAQTNGLPCLIADTITQQARQTGNVHFMSLTQSAKNWAEKALQISALQTIENRPEAAAQMRQAGYDISDVTKQFVRLVFGEDAHD